VILFRQQEFKNAFLEWILLDRIKHRKAVSKRLKRCFQIANIQAIEAFPMSCSIVASWIKEMFIYIEL
jgi:5'(3')-deoxyribonucleotidase